MYFFLGTEAVAGLLKYSHQLRGFGRMGVVLVGAQATGAKNTLRPEWGFWKGGF
jgi:hypothetical protein